MLPRKSPKIKDAGIARMLQDEYGRCNSLVESLEKQLEAFPKGSLVRKKIKVNGHVYEYFHLQWREGAKVKSRHLRKEELPLIKEQIEQRNKYLKSKKKLLARARALQPFVSPPVEVENGR